MWNFFFYYLTKWFIVFHFTIRDTLYFTTLFYRSKNIFDLCKLPLVLLYNTIVFCKNWKSNFSTKKKKIPCIKFFYQRKNIKVLDFTSDIENCLIYIFFSTTLPIQCLLETKRKKYALFVCPIFIFNMYLFFCCSGSGEVAEFCVSFELLKIWFI